MTDSRQELGKELCPECLQSPAEHRLAGTKEQGPRQPKVPLLENTCLGFVS